MKLLGGQVQSIEWGNFGLSDTDNDVCNEIKKWPINGSNLLKLMWKTMQEDKIERERIRRETEEKHEMNRREDRERLEPLIKQFRKDVERMRECLVEKCDGRANKLAGNISKLENKTEHSIVEVNKRIQKVEEVQSQQTSEARVSHAAIVSELVEHKQIVENSLSMFRNELIEFKNDLTAECLNVIGHKLDATSRDNSSELGKIDDRLQILERKVAAAAGTVDLPSISIQ
jgi:hypothetical protein